MVGMLRTRAEIGRAGERSAFEAARCYMSNRRKGTKRSNRKPGSDPKGMYSATAGLWSIFPSCPFPVVVAAPVLLPRTLDSPVAPLVAVSPSLSWAEVKPCLVSFTGYGCFTVWYMVGIPVRPVSPYRKPNLLASFFCRRPCVSTYYTGLQLIQSNW